MNQPALPEPELTEEEAADYFAVCLLMPDHIVRAEVQRMGLQTLADDRSVTQLAKKFQVPVALMATRLAELFGYHHRGVDELLT